MSLNCISERVSLSQGFGAGKAVQKPSIMARLYPSYRADSVVGSIPITRSISFSVCDAPNTLNPPGFQNLEGL